ncbi:hypothetical protein HID58_091640 [Brassica napus]|uniref:Uncharacterized protein n=1 Tax=Brassica napus TaxID=3708 RepID=A0ABQ7WZ52_BRANA|nr:hypothetical protein HID58_091640 [Brassica napus]
MMFYQNRFMILLYPYVILFLFNGKLKSGGQVDDDQSQILDPGFFKSRLSLTGEIFNRVSGLFSKVASLSLFLQRYSTTICRMTGTDKAFYISVDPSNIFDSSVLVTSGSPRFRSIVELRVDPHTISLPSFCCDRSKTKSLFTISPESDRPFPVIWLLSIKEFSDGLRYLPSCTKCKYPSHHRPALCSEMTRWQLMIGQSLETRELCFVYHTGRVGTFNTYLQGLPWWLSLGSEPTYELLATSKSVTFCCRPVTTVYWRPLFHGMARETRELPNPVATRARAADNWRQLVKRCHSARFLMNNKLSKANTREELWMSDLLYDEVSDWRKQNI